MQEKISVIIPVHNCEQYISKCLQSIINQTYKNLEIIIINDGSIDNSLKIIKQYQKMDSRIILIDKKNEGVSIARNTGINIATSKWITFVDSDDYLEKDAIENFAKEIADDTDIILSNVYCITNSEKQVAPCILEEELKTNLINSIFYDNSKWKIRYAPTPFAKLYNKNFLTENQIKFIENVKYGEDGLFNFLAFYYARKLVFIEPITYNYRIYADSTMQKYNSNLIEEYTKLLIELEKILIQKNLYDEYINEYQYFVIRQMNKFFNKYFFDEQNKKMNVELKKEFKDLLEIPLYYNALNNKNIKFLSYKRKLMIFLVRKKQFFLLNLFYKLNKRLNK